MAALQELLVLQYELEETVAGLTEEEEKKELMTDYLDKNCSSNNSLKHLFPGFQWLNVERDLKLKDLNGKVVILDFFTYCCINCMHILPTLHELEEKYKDSDELVVLGIHTAKFENEKSMLNLKNAIARYGIEHAVLNDPDAILWNKFGIMCWPTILIIGPHGNILFQFAGEIEREKLFHYCDFVVDYFKSRNQLFLEKDFPSVICKQAEESLLKYPGKIATSPNNLLLAISDSGHHRICIVNVSTWHLTLTIGGETPGKSDGNFQESKFNSPQGIAWYTNDIFYVADTENHLIRKVDLQNETVETIAGTGSQGCDTEGGKIGSLQAISSPWDLTLSPHLEDVLFIAMAGTHQIWVLFLEDLTWIDSRKYSKWTCKAFVGSGAEGNRNNSYPQSATLAQPSGITASNKSSTLFFADSESSSIRTIALERGSVKAVVGGDRDPTNLFSFGDQDGTGIEAKLQHPLGVAWSNHDDLLYVADSYNHKIKVVDTNKRHCQTLLYAGELNEPGGLCLCNGGSTLLVANTNNHNIQRIDLINKESSQLTLLSTKGDTSDADIMSTNDPPDVCKEDSGVHHDPVYISSGGNVRLNLQVVSRDTTHLNKDAPNSWSIRLSGEVTGHPENKTKGEIQDNLQTIQLSFDLVKKGIVKLYCTLYACSDTNGNCFMKSFEHSIPIMCHEGNDNSSPEITIKCVLDS